MDIEDEYFQTIVQALERSVEVMIDFEVADQGINHKSKNAVQVCKVRTTYCTMNATLLL